ncbi:MAG: hypothetical protein WC992_01315 [Acholeplasmataceae bacterium]|jgi:hypothetical protein|nr:hypothetical protein [Acholeplasmataceae bacterium]
MKKVIIVLILLLSIPMLEVKATPPATPDGIQILISTSSCPIGEAFEGGYLDLLVKREEVTRYTFDIPTQMYQDYFGHIETIDYLEDDDSIWMSYLAYVQGANIEGFGTCFQEFATQTDEYLAYNEVKLVYFDENGDTLYLSDPIEIEHPPKDGARYGEIEFRAAEPYQIENNYSIRGDLGFIVFYILIGPFIYLARRPIGWILYTIVFAAAATSLFGVLALVIVIIKKIVKK